jgi:hypothetical protein
MEYPALEKFIDRMGIKVSLKTRPVILVANPRKPFNAPSVPRICVEISVQYKGESQYEQVHCFVLNDLGELQYKEGDRSVSISDGVLSYLGDNKKVDEYFDQLARKKALERLRELKYVN